jgi:hypothetical protein
MTNPARLISRCRSKQPEAPQTISGQRRHAGIDPSQGAIRRGDVGGRALLSGIVVHTAVCDLPVTEWGP